MSLERREDVPCSRGPAAGCRAPALLVSVTLLPSNQRTEVGRLNLSPTLTALGMALYSPSTCIEFYYVNNGLNIHRVVSEGMLSPSS